MRTSQQYQIAQETLESVKSNILDYCSRFEHSAYYDSNRFQYGSDHRKKYSEFELVAAAKAINILSNSPTIVTDVDRFMVQNPDWLFGYLSYELKNKIYAIESSNSNNSSFKDYSFFQPETVFTIKDETLTVHSLLEPTAIKQMVSELLTNKQSKEQTKVTTINLTPTICKEEYIKKVNEIKEHIHFGDIYEINFCQEFSTTVSDLNPKELFAQLKRTSPTPFSAWLRDNDQYLLCASPERYIKKIGSLLFSQPIKGTCPRGKEEAEDKQNLETLLHSEKEISENVMIVDLVRNDLSRIAAKGSVAVEECCAPYAFPQVYQLISTVSCQLRPEIQLSDIIKATFPMGSMTGAPKLRAMQLADSFETFQRGVYSGAVGYITPSGDFDFNVVIRSFVYNQATGYLSYAVGGAITMLSEAEAEYSECLVKAQAMNKTLNALNGTDFDQNH